MLKSHTPVARPTFEIDLSEKILSFDCSENINILAFKRRILILAVDNSNADGDYHFEYRKVNDIPESEVKILKIQSSIIVKDVLFAVAAANYELKVYSANEEEATCLMSIEAHDGYINSIDFSEDYLATGSDDHTCKILSVKDNYEEHSVLNFSSAVTCVKFNSEEPNKLIISVKNGSLFIFCLKLRQSLYSLQTHTPLMNFDWSTKNPCFVAALTGDQVFYYDISKPDVPIYSKRLNDVGKMIKMHPQNPLVAATVCSRSGTELKVIHQKSTIPLFSTKICTYANNVVWNGSYLVTASDRKLCFFKIPVS